VLTHAVDILLVEDNRNDVELTLRAFARHRFANRVYVARDGQEALDWLFGVDGAERQTPRLILLDLKLPRVDGLDVLRAIRADEGFRKVPVVVLTSSREQSDIIESYDLGVNSYIVKPIEFDSFVEAVGALGFYWVLLNEPPAAVES